MRSVALLALVLLGAGMGAPSDERDGGEPLVGSGSLSKDSIREVIASHQSEVRACYAAELARHPDLEGKIVIRFQIDPYGLVDWAEVTENTTDSESFQECIADQFRQWIFPKPMGGGVVTVTYPFLFRLAHPEVDAGAQRPGGPAQP